MKKSLLIGLSIICFANCNVQAMSYKSSRLITVATALGAAYFCYATQSDWNIKRDDFKSILYPVMSAFTVGAITNLVSSSYTPSPLLNYVKAQIVNHKNSIIYYFLFERKYKDQELIEALEASFAKEIFPLVIGLNLIINLDNQTTILMSYLHKIIKLDDVEPEIKNEAARLLASFDYDYIETINNAIKTVARSPIFISQRSNCELLKIRNELKKLKQDMEWRDVRNNVVRK